MNNLRRARVDCRRGHDDDVFQRGATDHIFFGEDRRGDKRAVMAGVNYLSTSDSELTLAQRHFKVQDEL